MSWYVDREMEDVDAKFSTEQQPTGKYIVGHPDRKVTVGPFDELQQAEAKCNFLNGGDGLTKRERFALAAMQGMQTASTANHTQSDTAIKTIAKWAYKQADAMLAESEKMV